MRGKLAAAWAKTMPDRFWAKTIPEPNTGCWLWMGSTWGGGYGQVRINRRTRFAHRVAWEVSNGPIPNGLFVLHRCDNPPCVNPAHLFLGTHQDNMDDMMRKGRKVVLTGDRNGMRKHPERSSLNGHRIRRTRWERGTA